MCIATGDECSTTLLVAGLGECSPFSYRAGRSANADVFRKRDQGEVRRTKYWQGKRSRFAGTREALSPPRNPLTLNMIGTLARGGSSLVLQLANRILHLASTYGRASALAVCFTGFGLATGKYLFRSGGDRGERLAPIQPAQRSRTIPRGIVETERRPPS